MCPHTLRRSFAHADWHLCRLQKEEFIQQTMDIVELDGIAGAIVGMPGMYGLTGEQFKRLTIAVELVANPAIIFLGAPPPRAAALRATAGAFVRGGTRF